jgi:hypothetical protein
MRFIPAPLSFLAAISEAMFVPRISYTWHDTREGRGKAARKNTDAGATGRLWQNQPPHPVDGRDDLAIAGDRFKDDGNQVSSSAIPGSPFSIARR